MRVVIASELFSESTANEDDKREHIDDLKRIILKMWLLGYSISKTTF